MSTWWSPTLSAMTALSPAKSQHISLARGERTFGAINGSIKCSRVWNWGFLFIEMNREECTSRRDDSVGLSSGRSGIHGKASNKEREI